MVLCDTTCMSLLQPQKIALKKFAKTVKRTARWRLGDEKNCPIQLPVCFFASIYHPFNKAGQIPFQLFCVNLLYNWFGLICAFVWALSVQNVPCRFTANRIEMLKYIFVDYLWLRICFNRAMNFYIQLIIPLQYSINPIILWYWDRWFETILTLNLQNINMI